MHGGRRLAGRVAWSVLRGLRAVATTHVEPARLRGVESRRHLQWLVRYVLGQAGHHDLPGHPALWSGSCFQDLVGARAVLRLRLGEVLPRLRLRTAYEAVGLPTREIELAGDETVRRCGAGRLVAAAAAAQAVDPALPGRVDAVVRARRAACALAREVGLSTVDLAWALGVSPRAVRRAAVKGADGGLLATVRRRLALEESVGRLR